MWEAKKLYIPKCYTDGNCTSRSSGVVNENDIALFTLKKKRGNTPYTRGAHYLNYGWNNVGFTTQDSTFFGIDNISQITTLGYPDYLGDTPNNRGGSMIRTDSLSFINDETAKIGMIGSNFEQYYWGSGQSGGSSGSAVIINQGYKPNYNTSSKNPGIYSTENVVVSNISWGYTNSAIHVQGGSPFGQNTFYTKAKYKDRNGRNWGAGNIGALMRKVCGSGRGYHDGQADGICLNR